MALRISALIDQKRVGFSVGNLADVKQLADLLAGGLLLHVFCMHGNNISHKVPSPLNNARASC